METIRRVISERVAINSLLVIMSLATVFHLVVLMRIIPFEIVWGGRLKNVDQMIVFESVSLVLNVIMLIVVCLYAGLLGRVNQQMIAVALWLMTILFFINTVGNLLSTNPTERIIFTPLTAILCLFCFRLAISRKAAAPTFESES